MRDRLHFLFLNIGHFLDHLFTLIFATVAALVLTREWGLKYDELIPYATPGFIAFGVFSLPAGWLADRWSREGMMSVFFVGVGMAAIATAFAQSPLQIAIGLFVVGMFAAIYHPVGLALVARQRVGMGMAIAINGVWGNLGVASAALLTGFMIDLTSWRVAFIAPGVISIGVGISYIYYFWDRVAHNNKDYNTKDMAPAAGTEAPKAAQPAAVGDEFRWVLIRITAIIFFTTVISSIIFQGTTFSLPKVFDERLAGIATSATVIGWLAFVVFAIASIAQLIVGSLLDRYGPRNVFICVAAIQIVFFALMPGLKDWPALLVALGFMLGAFGQIPINDYMIGRMAKSELRASIYGARYIVSFSVLAAVIPLIAYVYHHWGFDTLFTILCWAAAAILVAVLLLPSQLPDAEAEAARQAQPARA
ncbi:MAG TPA: MFS transporter [Hyphomicrobiaceae bacterium]|nr:MFS transporter [Hyphomicrobiaceae bacterium]